MSTGLVVRLVAQAGVFFGWLLGRLHVGESWCWALTFVVGTHSQKHPAAPWLTATPPLPLGFCRQQEPAGTYLHPWHPLFLGEIVARRQQLLMKKPRGGPGVGEPGARAAAQDVFVSPG